MKKMKNAAILLVIFVTAIKLNAAVFIKAPAMLIKPKNSAVLSIDTVSVAQGYSGNVNIPVKAQNFKNIGAISLKISYDAAKIQFSSITSIAGNVKLNVHHENGVITIGWFDQTTVSPVSIADGKFFDIVFKYSGSASPVNFIKESCEIADAVGNVINFSFNNGYVSSKTTSVKKQWKSTGFRLDQNYPNPFNPSTVISYSIAAEARVILKVYSIMGPEIATLINKIQPAGSYFVDFHAASLPSGIYVYTLQADDFIQSSKMTLLR